MKRMLYRIVLCNDAEEFTLPPSVKIRSYCAQTHHDEIRFVYGRSFGESPWPQDWDKFDAFDADGAFIAKEVESAKVIGYVLSFHHLDYGYISVVAVLPEYHRKGIGFALIRTAIRYLHSLGLRTIKIDAYVDAAPAVSLYRKVGFQIEKTFEDEEDE